MGPKHQHPGNDAGLCHRYTSVCAPNVERGSIMLSSLGLAFLPNNKPRAPRWVSKEMHKPFGVEVANGRGIVCLNPKMC